MVSYIGSVIIAGVVGSLLTFLIPGEKNGSGKYVRFISTFVLLLIILSPLHNISVFSSALGDALKNTAQTKENVGSEKYTEAVIKSSAESISEYIMKVCSEKFGLDTEKMRVRLVLSEADPENVMIEEIQIFSGEKDKNVRDLIDRFFEDKLMCEVHVFGP